MKFYNLSKNLLIFSTILSFQACGGGNNTKPDKPDPIKINSNAIKINEILASNKNTITDPDYNKASDYIELYNSSDESINLESFGLSDTPDGDIWVFPSNSTIQPKSYLLIWADKKDTKATDIHTNFKLSTSGESLILYDKNMKVIDRIDFKNQKEDLAIARDKNKNIIYITPTPKKANDIGKNKKPIPVDETIKIPKTNIFINEIMASNTNTTMDKDFYKFSDWIEIYNKTETELDIKGYKLVDEGNPQGWIFPQGSKIAPNSYLIIWADKKSTTQREDGKRIAELHTNFKLNDKSEILSLYDASGTLLDKVEFKKQKADISYGRDKDKYTWGYMQPSFKEKNRKITIKNDRASKPEISLQNDKITITTDDGGTIYYTTDGSTPTKNSTKYSTPITYDKTIVVKSISYKNDYLPSKVNTETFIKNFETTLPTISLSIDSKYLNDDKIGIYVEGKNGKSLPGCGQDANKTFNFAQEWARPAYVEYFDKNKQKQFEVGLDARIAGQCSRLSNKKSFKLDLDNKYGSKSIKYKLFPTKDNIDKYKDFKIKTGYNKYGLEDILAATIAEKGNLNIDYQAYTAMRMFVNGEYWGVYNLREQKGKNYLKSNHPEIDSNLDIIKGGYEPKQGDLTAYYALGKYINEHNLTDATNYQEIQELVDIENFIDYMALLIYSGNDDWLEGNYRPWKERKNGTKWRWMLDDIDRGFSTSVKDRNLFNDIYDTTKYDTTMKRLFVKLSENSDFKTNFKNRFNTLLDSAFSVQTVQNILISMDEERNKYMGMEQNKWGITKNSYQTHVDDIKTFISARTDIVRNQLASF
jgi:hypothetical protein